MTTMKKGIIVELAVVLFIILFLYTAISKIMDYEIFKEQLAESPVLAPFSKLIAIGLPIVEFLVTILLIIPKWRLKGLYSSLILMTSFTVYIVVLISFSTHLPCSCGGVLAEMSWKQHIVFNSFFVGLSILAIRIERKLRMQHTNEWLSIREEKLGIKSETI